MPMKTTDVPRQRMYEITLTRRDIAEATAILYKIEIPKDAVIGFDLVNNVAHVTWFVEEK